MSEATAPRLGRSLLLASALTISCGQSTIISAPPIPIRFLDSDAMLVGNGPSACTNQRPPSADGHRWCGFTRSLKASGQLELWVIDVTAAARGQPPPCDGTARGCIRLADNVTPNSGPRFEGDTLIYGTDSVAAPNHDFLGRLFVWRPGWSVGRQVSSDRGFTCIGQGQSAAAACFDDPTGDPANRDSAQVRVGYVDRQDGSALTPIGRWPLGSGNNTRWEAAFAPDGTIFALSSAPAGGERKALSVLPTAEAGITDPLVVLDDVSYLRFSNDGQVIYFIRGLPQQADLYVAQFPSGLGATLIEPSILSFSLVGDRPEDEALGFVKDLGQTRGEFKLLTNRSQPAPKSIFTFEDILDGAIVSPDLRYTVWLDAAFRGLVIRTDDLQSCPINVGDEAPVFEPVFLDHAGLMFWKELRPDDGSRRDAFFAPPERCHDKTLVAPNIDLLVPIGDRGIVLTDDHEPITGRATLKYIPLSADGASPAPSDTVLVQTDVTSVAFVGEDPVLLIYSAQGATPESQGFFVFAPPLR